jgi:ADP-heptose:LPS heptosyltransferase
MIPGDILWIAEGQLGDLLLMTPALRAIHTTYPGSRQTILVVQRRTYDRRPSPDPSAVLRRPEGGTSAVFDHNPHVAGVMELDRALLRSLSPLKRLRAEASVIGWLRRQKFDTVISSFPQDRFYQWAFASGAPVRIGQEGSPASRLLTRRTSHKKEVIGVLSYYCRLAEMAGAVVASEQTECPVDPAAGEMMDGKLRSIGMSPGSPLLAVHPGASGPYNVWPPERFAEVIDAVRSGGTGVVLCGSEWDRPIVEAVRKECRSDVQVLLIEGGIHELGALLERSTVCLSNDSGPRHLAIAVGTKSVAVISRIKNRAWGIYGDPARSVHLSSPDPCPSCGTSACHDRIPAGSEYGSYCMRGVSAPEVLQRIEAYLGKEIQNPK